MTYPIDITVNVNGKDYAVFTKRADGNAWWQEEEHLPFRMCRAFENILEDVQRYAPTLLDEVQKP